MKYRAPLYLASQSPSRRELLTNARIPFTVIEQSADEAKCDWNQEPMKVASSIAREKMAHALIPEGKSCFVLTADSICVDVHGKVHGKPVDHEDAITMLKLWREGCEALTGFCLDRKEYDGTAWQTVERIEQVVSTFVEFDIPDTWLSTYLKEAPVLTMAGGIDDEYGSQFVKSISGSFTNVIGLPMFEVRSALTDIGFFVF